MHTLTRSSADLSGADLDRLHRAYFESRDPEIQALLCQRYAGLVRSIVRGVSTAHEYDDQIAVANIGLVAALQRFDPDLGFAFSTFATATISGELKRYRRNTAWRVHVPRRLQENFLTVHDGAEHLGHRLRRAPTIQELAEYTGLSVEDVIDALEVRIAQRPATLDTQDDDDPDVQLGGVDGGFEAIDRKELVAHLLSKLDARERRAVELRFFDGLHQREIAEELGISQMHVSRLLRRALERLRAFAG